MKALHPSLLPPTPTHSPHESSTHCGECPARAAATLILDGSDGTLITPVHSVGEFFDLRLVQDPRHLLPGRLIAVHGSVDLLSGLGWINTTYSKGVFSSHNAPHVTHPTKRESQRKPEVYFDQFK